MKKYLIIIFIVCSFIFLPTNIKAENNCSKEELSKIKAIVDQSEIKYSYIKNYTPTLEEQESGYVFEVKNRFEISINNLTDKYYAVIAGDGRTFMYDANREVPNTAIVNSFVGGVDYYFIYYTSENTNCPYTELKKTHIKLPKYNIYYEHELCKGIEEFNLCNKWYAGKITSTEFKNKATAYRESLNNDINVEENTILDAVIIYITNNYIYILLSIIVIGVVSIILIKYRENRNSKI